MASLLLGEETRALEVWFAQGIQWQNDPTATSAFKCSPLLNHPCALQDPNATSHTLASHWGGGATILYGRLWTT